jgi:hypothetical protein
MGRMCFWNGTIDAFRIFLGNCLISDHWDQTNRKVGMSSITLIFLCSWINEKERKLYIKFTGNKIQHDFRAVSRDICDSAHYNTPLHSVQLVETYVTLHTTIHHEFRTVSRDICDSSHYNRP